MGENRVLTLEEVLALVCDQHVYYEENPKFWNFGDSRAAQASNLVVICDGYGTHWRVWFLPQPPTPAELLSNPWPA